MRKLINHKNILVTLFALLAASPAWAQAAPAADKNWYLHDGTFWLLIVVSFILLYVIYALAEVVVWGGKKKFSQGVDKTKMIALLAVSALLFVGQPVMAQDAAAVAAPEQQTALQSLFSSEYLPLYVLILIEVMVIAYLSLMLVQLSKREQLESTGKVETWIGQVWEKWNYKVPIEREDELLMQDHEYDGIQELDNTMPPWLQYIFFFTIAFAIVYLWYYNFGSGLTQEEEYQASVDKAKIEQAAYLEKLSANYDENSVVISTEAAVLANGKKTFEQWCVTCHGAVGQGSPSAPNLTDDYWIHGGKINDVFKTVKYGVQGKAMAAWKEVLDPKQMFEVSNYVKSLHGSNPPDGKAPEGSLYVEGAAAPADALAAPTDTLTVADTVQTAAK